MIFGVGIQLFKMPESGCGGADFVEDIEDMMRGEDGTAADVLLPRERFNNRREVLLRPKKRGRNSAANSLEDRQVWKSFYVIKAINLFYWPLLGPIYWKITLGGGYQQMSFGGKIWKSGRGKGGKCKRIRKKWEEKEKKGCEWVRKCK